MSSYQLMGTAFSVSFAMGALMFAIRSLIDSRQSFFEELTFRRGIGTCLATWFFLLSIPWALLLIYIFVTHHGH